MDLVEAASRGVRAILFGELGLSEAKLLRVMKKGLKATKLYGKEALEHPDFVMRHAAAKDLLAFANVIAPSRIELAGPGGGPVTFRVIYEDKPQCGDE